MTITKADQKAALWAILVILLFWLLVMMFIPQSRPRELVEDVHSTIDFGGTI